MKKDLKGVLLFTDKSRKEKPGEVKGKSYFSLPRHPNHNQFSEIHCESVIYGNFLDLIFTRVFFNKLVERRAGFKCFCLPHGKELKEIRVERQGSSISF